VKQFFNDALNGEAAERSLAFNVADNMYRLE
jgi:hypothetical protein